MSPEMGKAGFTMALFIVLPSLMLLPFESRDSAEFYVTLMALAAGLLMLGVVIFMVRRGAR